MSKLHSILAAVILSAITTPAYAGTINLMSGFPTGPLVTPVDSNTIAVSGAIPGNGRTAGYISSSNTGFEIQNANANFGSLDLIGHLTTPGNYTTSGTESLTFSGSIFLNGNLIEDNNLTSIITWNSFRTSASGLTLSGTGMITDSSGGDDFETDFPAGADFNITTGLIFQCFRFHLPCDLTMPQGTDLAGGAITPTIVTVPNPPIGNGWLFAALTIAMFLFVSRRAA